MKTYTRKINYYETDQMGVVHHSNYIRYFEEARTSYMEQVGFPYARLEEQGIISPVIGVSCRYKKPIHDGDTVEIRVRLIGMRRTKCTFRYEIVDAASGELRAFGESEHCYLDRKGTILSIEKSCPEFYHLYLEQVEAV
jgi:acyl-CoA thioester hydrolase